VSAPRQDDVFSVRIVRRVDEEEIVSYHVQLWQTEALHPDGASSRAVVDEQLFLDPPMRP
jgi:hypothetical protein